MAWEDRRAYELRNAEGDKISQWPTGREAIRSEYNRREETYLGLAYRLSEIQRLGLFRALDSNGDESIAARRLVRDIIFVVGVDAAAIASDSLALDAPAGLYARGDGDPQRIGDLALAETIWSRSQCYRRMHEWALSFCMLGKWHFETVMTPAGPRIVGHDPRAVRVFMDPMGLEVERAIVTLRYRDPAEVDGDGEERQGETWHTYKRVLTRDEVRVYRDNELQADESGPHTLGVVPLTAAVFGPVHGHDLPTWAGHGMDDAVSVVDSLLTQMMTIGTRNANPILKVLQGSLGDDADAQTGGRAFELPEGADLQWLELTMTGAKALLDTAVALGEMVRRT